MIGHILQRAADDLVFVVQGHRRFQALFLAARVAQNGQKQQLEIAADKIAAVGIHIFGLADDLAQLGRLGGRQVEHPVRQPRGKLALQIKADREEAGRHVQIRILHMPLLRAEHHELALMQLDAVAVHNAVQRAAVDVRQLEHGVLLALEQEAALHLAVKQRIDLADAQAVASLAEAYDSTGELEENWDFRLSLSLFSDVGEAEAQVCDENGFVVLCSCDEFNCEHLGRQIDADLITEIDMNGETFRVGTLTGIHDGRRYIAGRPIVSDDTEQTIGYVIISSDMSQITDFMQRSSSLFFYSAIIVLVLSMAAATFLSHQQVQPLNKVAEAARRFGRGELDTRVEVPKSCGEEIVDLANAFNTMADSLEKSEQRRQEFVANVSHELKTPMTTIGGYIDGMLDGTIPPEKQQHYMQIVSGEVRRLSRLVRNMLDIAKLQAMGVEDSRKTRFDLGEELSDVLITFEQKIYNKHLDVRVDLPDKPVWTRAERDSITQVIYNLIENAIKFCPDGGRLSLRVRSDGGKARVSVENTGPTIDKDELPLLFDRFHKADKSRSADREGWGLGLYIAKTIVGAHGGDIWATSENGVTQFNFTLPAVR